jgi:hypothetical protein
MARATSSRFDWLSAPLIGLLWLLLLGAQLGGAAVVGQSTTVAKWAAKVQLQWQRQGGTSVLAGRAVRSDAAPLAVAHQAVALAEPHGGDAGPASAAPQPLVAVVVDDRVGGFAPADRQGREGWAYPSRGPPIRA